MAKRQISGVSEEAVDEYHTIAPLLVRLHNDIQELTKKKPDGVLSKTRVHMINRLLERTRIILKDAPSLSFLDLLDEEAVPQNADAMLIIGQYVSALRSFREQHTTVRDHKTVWIRDGYPEAR